METYEEEVDLLSDDLLVCKLEIPRIILVSRD